MQALKRILVVRLSSIGDIILTTPLLRRLKAAFPEARIDYYTKEPFTGLLASNPGISKVFTVENPPVGAYDLVVDLQNNIRSHAMLRSLDVSRTVRYHKHNWKKWLLIHFRMDLYGSCQSVAERYQIALKEFGVRSDLQGCELYPTAEDREFAAPFFSDGQATLALCFGAKHFTKRYPPPRFATVLSLLFATLPLRVLLLGGKEDAPHALEIVNALPEQYRYGVVNLAGSCSLMQTAALLERCDAVLSNDTGLMHMASAFSKQLFVLFGSSSASFGFLPYHTPFKLFEVEGLRCRPCSHIGREHCPKGHFRCMNELQEPLIAKKIIDYFNRERS
ncbi:MAG: glycosyltransferase family 9 protein [Chlorobiaceae bacterium]|nr:glycosyltransferase family 9 protein [Chlorobiaceae bacterium]